jgi:hypothetical protein
LPNYYCKICFIRTVFLFLIKYLEQLFQFFPICSINDCVKLFSKHKPNIHVFQGAPEWLSALSRSPKHFRISEFNNPKKMLKYSASVGSSRYIDKIYLMRLWWPQNSLSRSVFQKYCRLKLSNAFLKSIKLN